MTEVHNKGFLVILCSDIGKCFHGVAKLRSRIREVCSVDVQVINGNYVLSIFALKAKTELPHTESPAFETSISITGASGTIY